MEFYETDSKYVFNIRADVAFPPGLSLCATPPHRDYFRNTKLSEIDKARVKIYYYWLIQKAQCFTFSQSLLNLDVENIWISSISSVTEEDAWFGSEGPVVL